MTKSTIPSSELERQRARVLALQCLYGEQVRGPMTTDRALWETLKEAETKLRLMELEAEDKK